MKTSEVTISSKPLFDFILDRANIMPNNAIFETVDIVGSPDHIQDAFSNDFILQNINKFDIVILPDCSGLWWEILNIKNTEEQSIALYSLIENIMKMVKQGGRLYISKIHLFSDRVLDILNKLPNITLTHFGKTAKKLNGGMIEICDVRNSKVRISR